MPLLTGPWGASVEVSTNQGEGIGNTLLLTRGANGGSTSLGVTTAKHSLTESFGVGVGPCTGSSGLGTGGGSP